MSGDIQFGGHNGGIIVIIEMGSQQSIEVTATTFMLDRHATRYTWYNKN